MGQNNRERVLEIFYEFPEKAFTVRELASLSGVARATVHKVLVDLKKEGMVDKDGRAVWSRLFLTRKVNYFVEKIVASGLVDFLVEEFVASAVVLFGSIGKGDSVKESDVDIFVEAGDMNGFGEKGLDLKKFEKKIGHKVQLFVKSDVKEYHDNLYNNIVNGVRLYGGLKLK